MESRDAVVKEKKEVEEKVSAQRRVSNWNKCWAYWTAVLRGYRELPSDQLGARKFETASGLMTIVLEEGDPDVRVHGSASRRDVSLPNGKFGCAWDAIAARGKALLLAGATAEEVMQSIVKMGDRVGRLQESARLLRDEGRLGSCSLVVCTDRGKLALLHQVDVPRGFGTRKGANAVVSIAVMLGGNYVDWEGIENKDYALDNVVVRHPFPFPIRSDLFAVGIRMHVTNGISRLAEARRAAATESSGPSSSSGVKEKLAELVECITNSISVEKLTALRERVVVAVESSSFNNIIPNNPNALTA